MTIFGESAGALDINVLMTSPLAKGLYARLIGESGPVVAPPSLAEGEKKGLSVAASLKADSLKAMRALPAADLQKATGQGLSFLGPILGVVVDGWVLPKPPFEVFEAGQEHRVDLLLGTNARELTRPFFPVEGLNQGIAAEFGPLTPRALEVYGVKDGKEAAPDPVFGSTMAQWATDSQFRCGTVAELIWHSRAGNRSYQYPVFSSGAGPGSCRCRPRERAALCIRDAFDSGTRGEYGQRECAQIRCDGCRCFRPDAAILDELRQDGES